MSSASKERFQSPSSILTYLQCPRKYFYRYVKGLEAKPSIHLVLGRAVHSAISFFHKADSYAENPRIFLQTLHDGTAEHLNQKWQENRTELEALNLTREEEEDFYGQALAMLRNFCRGHGKKVAAFQHSRGLSLREAFERLRPKTETDLVSEHYGVRGRIDAVHDIDGETTIIDYKTSNKSRIDTEEVLQLAIYSLLFKETYGRMPNKAGIHFLRHGEKTLSTSPELLAFAKRTCQRIRKLTCHDEINKYPRKITGLCKYRTGQCDYYEICMPPKKELFSAQPAEIEE